MRRAFSNIAYIYALSEFGGQITQVAMPTLALVALNTTPVEMGLLLAIGFLPFPLFAIPAGAWLESKDKRWSLLYSTLARALLMLSIPMMWYLSALSYSFLCISSFLLSTAKIVFDVSYSAYLPEVITPQKLMSVNIKMTTITAVSQVAGPAVGAALLILMDAPPILLIEAALLLCAVYGLNMIPAGRHSVGRPDLNLIDGLTMGVKVIWRDTLMRKLCLLAGLWNMNVQYVLTVSWYYILHTQKSNNGIMGSLLATAAICLLVGANSAKRLITKSSPLKLVQMSMFLPPAGIMVFVLYGAEYPSLLIGLVLTIIYFASGIHGVCSVTIRQLISPRDSMSRTLAAAKFLSYVGLPVGAALGGFASSHVTAESALLLISISWVIGGLIAVIYKTSDPLMEDLYDKSEFANTKT
ncbi:MFS transporter [Pseudomonas graminis]|uniref:MFS transporter n=1 Tax=Pseudomonas graminis TaxID=158627 RepID=UPI002349ED01|nr:MFS transporter [Pseudomonas graminis]MDC6379903.1 MFS transporter [Pseudomonas graminis]